MGDEEERGPAKPASSGGGRFFLLSALVAWTAALYVFSFQLIPHLQTDFKARALPMSGIGLHLLSLAGLLRLYWYFLIPVWVGGFGVAMKGRMGAWAKPLAVVLLLGLALFAGIVFFAFQFSMPVTR